MKKYFLGTFAVAIAIGFSAFTNKPHEVKKFSTVYWIYNGPTQSKADRELSTNYITPSSTNPGGCLSSGNECVVELKNVTGLPAHPSFANVSFDTNGFPNGGTDFTANFQKH